MYQETADCQLFLQSPIASPSRRTILLGYSSPGCLSLPPGWGSAPPMAFLGVRLKPGTGVRKQQSSWRNKRSPSRGRPPPGPWPVWGTTRSHASEGVAPTEARKGPAPQPGATGTGAPTTLRLQVCTERFRRAAGSAACGSRGRGLASLGAAEASALVGLRLRSTTVSQEKSQGWESGADSQTGRCRTLGLVASGVGVAKGGVAHSDWRMPRPGGASSLSECAADGRPFVREAAAWKVSKGLGWAPVGRDSFHSRKPESACLPH